MSVAAASVGNVEEDGKRKPFNETGLYKAITLAVLTPVTAGVEAAGGAIPGHHLFQPLAAYSQPTGGVVPPDRSDPYHSDPDGEFLRIEAANNGGTASVSFNILGPGD
jgi:hypothetical protein